MLSVDATQLSEMVVWPTEVDVSANGAVGGSRSAVPLALLTFLGGQE